MRSSRYAQCYGVYGSGGIRKFGRVKWSPLLLSWMKRLNLFSIGGRPKLKVLSKVSSSSSPSSNKQSVRWKLPTVGFYRINVDVSIFPGEEFFSVGMVLRNQWGLVSGW